VIVTVAATMGGERGAGGERLKGTELSLDDPYYLHYRSLFSDLRDAAGYAHGVLLDIGCGNKPYERFFEGQVSHHVGCDLVQSSKGRADVICPATELAFKDGSYDTVLLTQVVEHVADHRELLREAFRVLRPGGVLILSGPMYWPLHGEPYDYFRFTEHGFRFLLKTVGLEEIKIVNNGGKWALCGQMLVHTIRNTRLPYRFSVRWINRIFSYLDDRSPTRDDTMNYVVIARKPVLGK
jgi:SAM-dependent methyltransferase